MTCNCSVLLFAMPSKVAFFLLFKGIHRQWVVKEVIDTSRAIHFISLTHKKRKKNKQKKQVLRNMAPLRSRAKS